MSEWVAFILMLVVWLYIGGWGVCVGSGKLEEDMRPLKEKD